MSDEKKTPQPGEWWFSSRGSRVLVLPSTHTGRSTVEAEEGWIHHNWNFDDWHHEPACTGWDWQPPPPIDPGEGWELLPVGTVLQDRDEYFDFSGVWIETQQAGECIGDKTMDHYRRRKPPAETWPKWYVHNDVKCQWFIKRSNERKSTIHRFFGEDGESTTYNWDLSDSASLANGVFIEVTKSEALARVKPVEPIAQVVERTATPLVPATVESPDDWVEITDPEHVLRKDMDQAAITGGDWQWISSSTGLKIRETVWTKARCRRRDLPALQAPLPALIPGVATDRMVDLFLSWRLPSDFQPDGGISFTSRPIHESWPTGTNLFTASQARKMIEHLLSVPEEAPPPPAPQPKRIPLSLWVHGNVTEVGGWSVFAGRPNFGSYKEIKFDGSGFYVESAQ